MFISLMRALPPNLSPFVQCSIVIFKKCLRRKWYFFSRGNFSKQLVSWLVQTRVHASLVVQEDYESSKESSCVVSHSPRSRAKVLESCSNILKWILPLSGFLFSNRFGRWNCIAARKCVEYWESKFFFVTDGFLQDWSR